MHYASRSHVAQSASLRLQGTRSRAFPGGAWHILLVALVTSCGSGTAALFGLDGDSNSKSILAAPIVSDVTLGAVPDDGRVPPVTFTFRLTDANSRPTGVSIYYVPPGAAPEEAANLTGNLNVSGLATSPTGVVHTRVWDFVSQVPSGAAFSSGHRLIVRTDDASSEAQTAVFAVGNDAPVVSIDSVPAGTIVGPVTVNLTLVDSSDDTVSVTAEYDVVGDGMGWLPATPMGAGLANVAATSAGVPLVFLWNAAADLVGTECDVMLRFTPTDDLPATGAATMSSMLHLDNDGEPLVTAFAIPADPNNLRSSPLPIDFTLADPEDDTATVEIYYLPPGGAPAVPALLSGNTNLAGLTAAAGGSLHSRHWDFAAQTAGAATHTTGHTLLVRATDGGSQLSSSMFDVGNNAPVVSGVMLPAGVQTGATPVDLTVADSTSDLVDVFAEYELDGNGTWLPATPLGPALTNIASTPSGVAAALAWDSATDVPGQAFTARLRFTPSDDLITGATVTTASFSVDNNVAATVSNLTLPTASALRTSPLSFDFTLSDDEGDAVDVQLLYLPPGGGAGVPMLLTGDTNQTALATTPGGTVHTRQWDFAGQLAGGSGYQTGYKIFVGAVGTSSAVTSATFDVGNDAPLVSGLAGPAGEGSEIVQIDLTVTDSSSDVVSVLVEYDNLDDGAGYQAATPAGPPLAAVGATPGGTAAVFYWNAEFDEPGAEFSARLRFTPNDGTATGTPVTIDVVVDNNAEPIAVVSGSAFLADPDQRRGIPLPVTLIEEEGDALQVIVQWRMPFQAFPVLPSSPSGLAAVLADPVLRRAAQIATEAPLEYRGRTVPTGVANTMRLPELVRPDASLDALTVSASDVELLRPSTSPTALAATWSANPLVSPVALLARNTSALVLEAFGGGWRLIELELATGTVIATIATDGTRTPNALAESHDDANTVLIADEVAGVWRVSSVDLTTGDVTEIATATGSTELGTVRGLTAVGSTTTLLTVGSSLVQIDAADAMAPVESALFDDFAEPRGIAFDKTTGRRLYVAERDWVDPLTAMIAGRVVAVDLASHARTTVVATGAPFARAEAVGLELDGSRLVVLTDSNTGDAMRELRAVHLAGGDAGAAYEVAAALDADASALATGPDLLRLVLLPGALDIAAGGGVEQSRSIASFDVATATVTVDTDFDPSPAASQPWRIRDVFGAAGGSLAGFNDVFVWDSSDLIEAGEVVLRVTPYDSEMGLATNTGVPRPVRSSVDVTPTTTAGGGSTDGVHDVHLVDINGDGELDLVTANSDGDDITIFLAVDGRFPASPDITLTGIPILAPTDEPIALVVLDGDDDGDQDIVSLNRSGDSFNVFVQTLPGIFTTLSPLLVLGLDQPEDIAAGDVNGDGLIDVVIADTGDDEIEIFHQLLAGLFGLTSNSTLGDASTLSPSAVEVADLDGDGDLDIVSSNAGSDNVTVFLQNAFGAFPSAPSLDLGGVGVTDGAADVVAADLNGDGLIDIASANETGNDLTVFLQGVAGFATLPDFTLSHANGPLLPHEIHAVDVNGDGYLDLVSANGAADLTVFFFDASSAAFSLTPLVLSGGGLLMDPNGIAVGDVDGNGYPDLLVGDTTTDEVYVFHHDGGSDYPDVPGLRGSSVDTPQPEALVAADLDGDGDIDLATANAGDDTISLYEQFSPGVFSTTPKASVSSSASTPGIVAIDAADLDGDGRLDLIVASSGELAIFLQTSGGAFPAAPDSILGGGTMGAPAHVLAADLNGDGALDLVAAEETSDRLAVFFQSAPGVYPATADALLGSGATTNGPVHVAAADLDGDGDHDLVCANAAGGDVAIFFRGPGGFPAAPDLQIGGAGNTDTPAQVCARDLDGDGDIDLAVACTGEDGIAIFFQTTPGAFPAVPDLLLTDASFTQPTTLAAADLDGDGDVDLVCGNEGSTNLVVFRQTVPGSFLADGTALGGAGSADTPRGLVAIDLDGDGDTDLAAVHPSLDRISIYFASH